MLSNGNLACSSYSYIQIWDMTNYQLVMTFSGHTSNTYALVQFTNDLLISGSTDYTVKIWNITSGNIEKNLNPYNSIVYALAKINNYTINICGVKRNITFWNVTSQKSTNDMGLLGNLEIIEDSYVEVNEISVIYSIVIVNKSHVFYAADKSSIVRVSLTNNSDYRVYQVDDSDSPSFAIESSSKQKKY